MEKVFIAIVFSLEVEPEDLNGLYETLRLQLRGIREYQKAVLNRESDAKYYVSKDNPLQPGNIIKEIE